MCSKVEDDQKTLDALFKASQHVRVAYQILVNLDLESAVKLVRRADELANDIGILWLREH